MNRDQLFDLKLASGKVVVWNGASEEDAAVRYVDCHRGATVVATRPTSEQGQIRVWGGQPILEPGDRGWGRRERGG